MIKKFISLAEKGFVPDVIIRAGIRFLLKRRIDSLVLDDKQQNLKNKKLFIEEMDKAPIALVPDLANQQHYEIPAILVHRQDHKQVATSSPFRQDSIRQNKATLRRTYKQLHTIGAAIKT